MEKSDEFALIRSLSALLPQSKSSGVLIGIGDDCSVTQINDNDVQLVSKDLLVEKIHFDLNYTDFYSLGYKALAVNLSDIAAMGGRPLHFYLGLAFNAAETSEESIKELYRGIGDLAKREKVSLLGGDLTSSPDALMISITIIGKAKSDQLLLRSGAKIGDRIFLSGVVGDSSAGLDALRRGVGSDYQGLVDAHLRPSSELAFAQQLAATKYAHSAIDVSDGLSGDSLHIADASDCSLVIDKAKIPLSDTLREYAKHYHLDPYAFALHGGEDYKLLISGDSSLSKIFPTLIDIGEVVSRREYGSYIVDEEGKEKVLESLSWNHLKIS